MFLQIRKKRFLWNLSPSYLVEDHVCLQCLDDHSTCAYQRHGWSELFSPCYHVLLALLLVFTRFRYPRFWDEIGSPEISVSISYKACQDTFIMIIQVITDFQVSEVTSPSSLFRIVHFHQDIPAWFPYADGGYTWEGLSLMYGVIRTAFPSTWRRYSWIQSSGLCDHCQWNANLLQG